MPDDPRPSRPTTHPELLDSSEVERRMHLAAKGSMRAFWWMQAIQGLVTLTLLGGMTYLLISAAQNNHNTQVTVQQYIAANDQRWCKTMDLLTATPVYPPANPAANPSRVAAYQLYVDFMDLRRQFNCG
jgi:hypothetical protein